MPSARFDALVAIFGRIRQSDVSQATPKPFPFLKLPPEIRIMVYEKIYKRAQLVEVDKHFRGRGFDMAPLRTCRQLKEEIEAVFYGHNKFAYLIHMHAKKIPVAAIEKMQKVSVQMIARYHAVVNAPFEPQRIHTYEFELKQLNALCRMLSNRAQPLRQFDLMLSFWPTTGSSHNSMAESGSILSDLNVLLLPFEDLKGAAQVQVLTDYIFSGNILRQPEIAQFLEHWKQKLESCVGKVNRQPKLESTDDDE